MKTSWRSVTLLALCQSLAMTVNTVLITVAALIGFALASDKALATLPLALQQIATATTTIPAALLMRRLGRRVGFLVGALIGCASAGVSIYSLQIQSFELFCLAIGLNGIANGFVGYYRFAAAEAAPPTFRAQAISWVVAGGVAAAIAGPWLTMRSQVWFPSELYQGALLIILSLQIVAMVLLLGVKLPSLSAEDRYQTGRPLAQIVRQPVFIVAVLGSMSGYGVMALVMTATPLAMAAVEHPFTLTATVIQWHVLGMFAPSLAMGWLIRRFGVLTILMTGAVLNLLCLGLNLMGVSFGHFAVALLLLGVGWNFMFVGATTLLTEAYTPVEKAKTQATHDFLMFGFVACSTFLSGHIFYRYSWSWINTLGWPPILLALVAVLWFQRRHRVRLVLAQR